MAKKRERLELIHELLLTIQKNENRISPTTLQHKCNFSTPMFKQYMDELLEKGFIRVIVGKKGRKYYSLRDRGYEFLEKYRMIAHFIDEFGL